MKRKHDSNCYPQSSRPSNGRSRRLNVVSIYFAEAPHFTEHKYIPHEIRTICLDFTMWTSHCSASISHSCSAQAYIPYILGIYSLVPLTAHDSWLDHIRVGEMVKMKRLMMRMSRPARLLSISLTGFFSAPDVAAALASLPELRR